MSVASLLARGRARAEALMLDECTITRTTARTTGAGGVVTTTKRVLYSGACKVQTQVHVSKSPEIGAVLATITRLSVDVPIDETEGITVGDIVTITSVEFDDDLDGRTFTVIAPFRASQKTARRLPVEEVVG